MSSEVVIGIRNGGLVGNRRSLLLATVHVNTVVAVVASHAAIRLFANILPIGADPSDESCILQLRKMLLHSGRIDGKRSGHALTADSPVCPEHFNNLPVTGW